MSKTALVIEDDRNISELLRIYLEHDGYTVETAANGALGVTSFEQNEPDIVLLDIMLPVMDGWQVLKQIRLKSKKVPVIMLTAKGETDNKVLGLESGADDYISKPFEISELLARIHAVTRRTGGQEKPRVLEFVNLVIDMDRFTLTVAGKRTEAPPKEMELLFHLASSPNRVYTRNQLLDEVWGFDYYGDSRTVDVHVKRLREKLEGVSDTWALKTVWGVGYKFEVND
ncbi:MAG: response regulator transcription factor [Oscillospiraceae bacterium]|jgi:DNA-binding response OmpR family regulator|nr:response regulator transcription factor [Oscillospiraceae bacterium]